jgi:hypothetical protein
VGGSGFSAGGATTFAGAAAGAGDCALASRSPERPLNTTKPRMPAPITPTHTVIGESAAWTRGRAASPRAKTGLRSAGV